MSVHFKYHGTFGNNLFQYMTARLFADEHDLKLETPWTPLMDNRSPFDITKIMNIRPQQCGRSIDSPIFGFGDGSDVLGRRWEDGCYVLDGYFQRPKWFYDRKEEVLRIANAVPVSMRGDGDIVATVRLGGYYVEQNAIHPEWYCNILDQESFDHLYIVTDSPTWGYFDAFKRYNPTIANGAAHDDWNFVRSFRRIICANSTFHWWAVFFGHPEKVWTFKRWLRLYPNSDTPYFPGSIPLDGRFLHEDPVYSQP